MFICINKDNKYNGSNEYQKAIDFLKKGCKCGCSSRIPKEEFAELRESFQALSKSEQDIFLMAQLKAMDCGLTSASRRLKKKTRSNKRTFYHWDHNTPLCTQIIFYGFHLMNLEMLNTWLKVDSVK